LSLDPNELFAHLLLKHPSEFLNSQFRHFFTVANLKELSDRLITLGQSLTGKKNG
jgi:hypothetical protein